MKLLATSENIILDHNTFAFGNTFWCQLKGIAMGIPVACVVDTLFFPSLPISPHHSTYPPGVLRSIINSHLRTTWLHSTYKATY